LETVTPGSREGMLERTARHLASIPISPRHPPCAGERLAA
jgi:hypothetical protein